MDNWSAFLQQTTFQMDFTFWSLGTYSFHGRTLHSLEASPLYLYRQEEKCGWPILKAAINRHSIQLNLLFRIYFHESFSQSHLVLVLLRVIEDGAKRTSLNIKWIAKERSISFGEINEIFVPYREIRFWGLLASEHVLSFWLSKQVLTERKGRGRRKSEDAQRNKSARFQFNSASS